MQNHIAVSRSTSKTPAQLAFEKNPVAKQILQNCKSRCHSFQLRVRRNTSKKCIGTSMVLRVSRKVCLRIVTSVKSLHEQNYDTLMSDIGIRKCKTISRYHAQLAKRQLNLRSKRTPWQKILQNCKSRCHSFQLRVRRSTSKNCNGTTGKKRSAFSIPFTIDI